MRIIGIIPARYASTRVPGKPLALIAGKSLIQHVVERCQQARSLAEIVVATDDQRIADAAAKFCRVEMTRADHPSGSDRIAEVTQRNPCDAVVNIQGDEPLIDPAVIDAVASALDNTPPTSPSAGTTSPSPPRSGGEGRGEVAFRDQGENPLDVGSFPGPGADMSTAATLIRNPDEYDNPNVVKVVVNSAGRALYFSRRTIPYLREAASRSANEQLAAFPFLKHLGIYGYRRNTLLRLVKFPVSPLEQAEKLEQLRALENGIPIAVVKVNYDSVGVDVPEDVARVEEILTRDERG
jgi:3-deoxy-manno-octulosonate cytidylyltransferase (CMP-KDO synthetase)